MQGGGIVGQDTMQVENSTAKSHYLSIQWGQVARFSILDLNVRDSGHLETIVPESLVRGRRVDGSGLTGVLCALLAGRDDEAVGS